MNDEHEQATEQDESTKRQEMDEVQEKLDDEADGDGLAAEADRGEQAGLSEG